MSAYKPSVQDIMKLHQEASEGLDNQPHQSFFQNALESTKNAANDYGVTAFGTHALSAPLHLAENVANLPKELMTNPNAAPYAQKLGAQIPKAEIPDKYNPEKWVDLPDNGFNKVGGFFGDMVGFGGAENRVARGVNALTHVGARTPLARRVLQGAAQGYVTGSDEGFGGRGGSAAIGGVAPWVHGLSKSQLGQKATQISNEIQNHFSGLYNSVLHRAEQAGVRDVPVPAGIRRAGSLMEHIRHFGRDVRRGRPLLTINHYLENPTLRGAHEAQSALAEIERSIPRGSEGTRTAVGIQNWRDRIQHAMQRQFQRARVPELGHEYTELGNEFAREGVHFKHPTISAHRAGNASAADVATDLLATRGFAHGRGGRELPGFRTRHAIEPVVKIAKPILGAGAVIGGVGSALGAAGVTLPDWAKQLIEHSIR